MNKIFVILTAFILLSGCYMDNDRIIDKSTKAIERNPDNVKAYIERGDAYESKGFNTESKNKKDFYNNAIADYTMAIKIDRLNSEAYDKRGWIYYINDIPV